MRHVEIAPGVVSSVLGFGCAPIQGSVGAQVAARAIDCALDCGVTHFDLARSYGYGEAEAFVGKQLGARRAQVILASKFGIQANWKAGLLKPLKPLVRTLRAKRGPSPAQQPSEAGPTVADRFLDRIPLSPTSMRKSLHTSLRAIGTDYIDVLFIHEPLERIEQVVDLILEGAKLKKEGKIRALGLAISWATKPLHEAYLADFDALQYDNSPGAAHYQEVAKSRGAKANVFFSPLRGSKGPAQQTLTQMWRDFPQSVILCSMFKEEHIHANATWASNPSS
jgi:aryl-alcohol dehydrogenase-like predicted oxidoreductase